ncbi:AlbA family DNA-binding domain-containing protein [Kribbella sp. CA-294648]|uniref:AlbA family DNA-binding domain-containing protein n=1 Tax=Kribbella sp. CA-294648 TaxID=3239948 RepID=UPI003D8B3FF9
MAQLHLDRLPRGQIEWDEFVTAVATFDDRAERYFLELKSDVDLSTEAGRAKVAKFILGAANRMPDLATRRFDGHGLLVLGISKGAITGIPFFEAKDLAATVKKYTGADGPRWDFERVRVSDTHDVIIVIVDPPKIGDPVWTCYKDGHENLYDGGIYIRVDGETRQAKGDEVRVLLQRAEKTSPGAVIEVAIDGSAAAYRCDQSLMIAYINTYKSRLERTYRLVEGIELPPGKLGMFATGLRIPRVFEEPEDRTLEEYTEQIEQWAQNIRDSWDGMVDAYASVILPGSQIRVRNASQAFLENLEIEIHLEGPVEATERPYVDSVNPTEVDPTDLLPSPPREWGPRSKFPAAYALHPNLPGYTVRPAAGSASVSFRNGGSVDFLVRLDQLRPERTIEIEDDEFTLVLTEPISGSLTGHWTATAQGYHEVFAGTLDVTVGEEIDLTPRIRRGLLESGD